MTLPCLLYVGEADSFYPGAREGVRSMANARFVSFPGLNHSQTSQASHLVVPHVTRFLHDVMQDTLVTKGSQESSQNGKA
jgi:hypothetical protein